MEPDAIQNPFSKALLTSVFVGIICTIICLVYNIIYRQQTGLEALPDVINVSSLIFGINLVFLVAGLVYSFLKKFSPKGDILFTIIFILITIFLIWKTEGVNSSSDHETSLQLRGLLLGIVIIVGVGASLVIPILFNNKKFNDGVL